MTVIDAQILVLAKEPVPGSVKTRLTPPYSAEEAAELARAALEDTLEAVARTPVRRRVLVLSGAPGPWLPAGFDVVGQRGGELDERIAGAFADARAGADLPALLIGMDTPQVTPGLLGGAAGALSGSPAVLGLAHDGGFWALGMRDPDPELVRGVPMSSPLTGEFQLARLRAAGLDVRLLDRLNDVDDAWDASDIAVQAPGSRFARTLAALEGGSAQSEPAPTVPAPAAIHGGQRR
ncbi:MAG: DUF2064 domain-containing protein [Streptosporangiales bacterium]|nr:DUF2064 domain-containing protein [Streptosporangiales bacterium]